MLNIAKEQAEEPYVIQRSKNENFGVVSKEAHP